MDADRKEPRKSSVNYLYLGFILLLAMLFATQWGPGSGGCQMPFSSAPSTAAAVVNGTEIPLSRYQRDYRNFLESFRRQGQSLSEEQAKQFGLPKRVIDQLVDREALAQAAVKQGIDVSDEELAALIQRNPSFQKDGKFDEQLYHRILQDYYRMNYAEFEGERRQEMRAMKLLQFVSAGATVSNDELRTRYEKQGNKADITFVRFLDSMFAKDVAKPKDSDLAAFVKAHEKDIQDYYTANQFTYQQKEQVKARHILVKVDKDASAADKEKAKQKIEALRKEIEAGKDFGAVAKESSEDTSSKKEGGELGWNERDNWVPEFATAAFGMKAGELSQPVLSSFGYHLIQVEDKKAAQEKKLEEVKKEIAAVLWRKEKAKAIAKEKADKALASLKAGKALKDLYPAAVTEGSSAMNFEVEAKPEAKVSGEFTASQGGVPLLGPAPDLERDVFAVEGPKALDKVYPVGDGFVVAQVTSRNRPSDPDFTKQHDMLLAEALRAKQFEIQESFVKSVRKEAKVTYNKDLTSGATFSLNPTDAEG